jgi:hypothetical protein
LDDQDPEARSEALNGHAQKGRVNFFACFRHKPKAFGGWGIRRVDGVLARGHPPHQAFPKA